MRVIFVAPAGAGKGTQARILEEKFGIPQIATGDMFRAAIKAGTELGNLANSYIKDGNLVPDEVAIGMLLERLQQPDAQKGFVLDGFPRTLPQAKSLTQALDMSGMRIDRVIQFVVNEDEMVERALGRFTCTKCNEGYHEKFKRPKVENKCDKCGAESSFKHRDDDNEAGMRKRLQDFKDLTAAILPYYEQLGLLRKVDGMADIPSVTKQIELALK